MKKGLLQAILLPIILGFAWIASLEGAFAAELSITSYYHQEYAFTFHHERYWSYWPVRTLYVSLPASLYHYYRSNSHRIQRDSDYAKFVTPEAVSTIAKSIQEVTRNLPYSDEQFANAVLTLVHKIPYAISGAKYPVETIVDNFGDCVALSLLAASIMKAGGLDVVLIHYTEINPGHINVGVHLPHTPVYRTWWMPPTSFEYNNKTYWTAEATSMRDWKIGDQAWSLGSAKPVIIPLQNFETSAPARVSASLGTPLNASSISINISFENSSNSENTADFTVSGSISPAHSGESIVMYVSDGDSSLSAFKTVTDKFGNYRFYWNFSSAGSYYFWTSWSGSSNCAAADSEVLKVFVGPPSAVQYSTPSYNYVLGPAVAGAYWLSSLRGVKEFLDVNVNGSAILLTSEFIVLRGKQATSNVQMQTVTIPRSEQTIWLPRSRRPIIIMKPEQNVTVVSPVDVPAGTEPLRLPANFDRTINNHLGLFLHRADGGYVMSVRGMNFYDVDQMKKLSGENRTVFMDASAVVNENKWYYLAAKISGDKIHIELFDANNTLVKNMEIEDNAENIDKLGIVIASGMDTVIVFRNLRIESFNPPIQPTQQIGDKQALVAVGGRLAPFIVLFISLVAVQARCIKSGKENMQTTE